MDAAITTIIDTIQEELYLYDIEFDRDKCDKLFELLYEVYLRNDNLSNYKTDMTNFVKHCFEINDYSSTIIKYNLFLDNLKFLNLSNECIEYIKEELLVKKK